MSLSSIFARRPDPSDASSAFAAQAEPAAGPGLGDVILAAGGSADSQFTRWVGYGLVAASIPLALYDIFQPSILAVAFLLTVPLAVMALLISSPTSFEHRLPRTGRRIVNGALMLPFGALILPNVLHAQVNPLVPLVPAALAATVIAPLAWLAKSRPGVASPWTLFVFVIGCAAAYGYGAVAAADIQFDTSAGATIPAAVLGKHETHGRRSTSYYLDLAAWGPRNQPNSVEVFDSTYNALNAGDTVCIVLHPGFLNLAWFTADVCKQPPPS
jgi:hypothetical protein